MRSGGPATNKVKEKLTSMASDTYCLANNQEDSFSITFLIYYGYE